MLEVKNEFNVNFDINLKFKTINLYLDIQYKYGSLHSP